MILNRSTTVSSLSRRASLFAFTGCLAVLAGAFAGCNTGPKGPVTVPLEFRPQHSDPLSISMSVSDVKVHLDPVADKRDNKEQIGRNVEDEVPVPIYAGAEKAPTDFVHGVIEEELKTLGVQLTESADAADRVINIELIKFWCEEGNQYKAEVRGLARVRDKGGRELWRGTVGGDATNFGRSLSASNYTETLSDATRRMVATLLSNPKLQEALTR